MKRILFFSFFLLFAFNSFAQFNHELSLQSGFYSNGIVRFTNLEGASSYEHQNSFSLGLGYKYSFNDKFSLKPEVHWLRSTLTSTNISTSGLPARQDIALETFNIPVLFSYSLNNYFFMEAGPVLHFQIKNAPENYLDQQSGLGFSLGVGLRYTFSEFVVFAKPSMQILSLIPFSFSNYQERLLSAGFIFGLGYNF